MIKLTFHDKFHDRIFLTVDDGLLGMDYEYKTMVLDRETAAALAAALATFAKTGKLETFPSPS